MRRRRSAPWITAPGVPPELALAWAEEWPRWFGPARVVVPRAPDKDQLALVTTALGPVVAKRSRASGWKRPLVRLGARRPRPERAFRNAQALGARGLLTPEPLAVLGSPDDCVLVTHYVDGSDPWDLWSREGMPSRLIEELARGLARLHGAGFRHRDLKASNLLFRGTPETPELVWTDLDGLRYLGTVEGRLRARDLARLGTSFESAPARAAGVRAGHWEKLVARYLESALARRPRDEELQALLGWTRQWRERWILRHLAEGQKVL